jgi:hypothetical protein
VVILLTNNALEIELGRLHELGFQLNELKKLGYENVSLESIEELLEYTIQTITCFNDCATNINSNIKEILKDAEKECDKLIADGKKVFASEGLEFNHDYEYLTRNSFFKGANVVLKELFKRKIIVYKDEIQ